MYVCGILKLIYMCAHIKSSMLMQKCADYTSKTTKMCGQMECLLSKKFFFHTHIQVCTYVIVNIDRQTIKKNFIIKI